MADVGFRFYISKANVASPSQSQPVFLCPFTFFMVTLWLKPETKTCFPTCYIDSISQSFQKALSAFTPVPEQTNQPWRLLTQIITTPGFMMQFYSIPEGLPGAFNMASNLLG